MNVMKRLFVVTTVVIALSLMMTGTSTAQVNLEWRPVSQTIIQGDTASIGLFMVAAGQTTEYVSALDVVVRWDTTYLDFVGLGPQEPIWLMDGFPTAGIYGNINNDLSDGDAFYNALALFGTPVEVTSAGVLAVDFHFTGLQSTSLTEIMLEQSYMKNGTLFSTRVFSGLEPNLNILGSLHNGQVEIVPIPEPLSITMAGIGLITAALVRRRSSSR